MVYLLYNRDINITAWLEKEGNLYVIQKNAYRQVSFINSFSGLTAREQKALEKSWTKFFAEKIIPTIDEKRFSILYSDKASRPSSGQRDCCCAHHQRAF